MIFGTQLFKNSSGSLIWGDGLNFPTPFGGFLSTGSVRKTYFDHGIRVEPPPNAAEDDDVFYLVDPIPGDCSK